MTELMQGRGLENLGSFEVPTFDMGIVSDSFNLESHFIDSNGKIGFGFLRSVKSFEYAPWSYLGKEGSAAEFNYLTDILDAMGKEVYLREYSYLGFYSCQMIVPGFSEIYPIDDLIYNNRNRGKWVRNMVLHFDECNPAEILEGINSLDDGINVDSYIGVIFENGFTMLELKAQIHLILGNVEEALAYLEIGTNKLGHIVAELVRMSKKKLVWEEYQEALFNIYGRERVEKARRIVEGEEFLINTKFHSDYHNMLGMYDRLERKKQTGFSL
jgi:ribosomal protein S12 methylthiotransferase accessory factor